MESIGRTKSSTSISISGVPCTSPWPMRLKQISMRPASGRHPVRMLAHRCRVQGVHDRRVQLAATGSDRVREGIECGLRTAGDHTWKPAATKAFATAEPSSRPRT
jgi:hypothetical protein